jgi:hypothetical protein
MLWSDDVSGLVEIVEVGSRVGVPGKKGVASSQDSEGDVLWSGVLPWWSWPSVPISRPESGVSLSDCEDPTSSLNVSKSLLPSSLGSSRSRAASMSWTDG